MSPDSHARLSLAENPWFWLMLFGCMASVGVVVIGPKHAARQARLERMADTRDRVNTARQVGTRTADVRRTSESKTPIEPYEESDFRRSPKLVWLLGLTVALMLIGTAGMIVTQRRGRLETWRVESRHEVAGADEGARSTV